MLSLAKFIRKEIELRENLVGTGFLDPPPLHRQNNTADFRVTVAGEIVSASGFNASSLYVFYDTLVSEGWTFEDQNDYEMFGTVRDDTIESNKRYPSLSHPFCRNSVTQVSDAVSQLVSGDDAVDGTEQVCHFGFPLDF